MFPLKTYALVSVCKQRADILEVFITITEVKLLKALAFGNTIFLR